MNFEWDINVRWAYYIILAVYVLVIGLRIINAISTANFKKSNPDSIKVFTIKHDFFTTVSICCILATSFINGAAILTDHRINYDTILITILVVIVTVLNSFYTVRLNKDGNSISYLGYEIKPEEVEEIALKSGMFGTTLGMSLTKDIDSYSYVKMHLLGKNKRILKEALEVWK